MASRITYRLIFTLITFFSTNILFAQTEISEIDRKRQEFKALLQQMPDEAKDFIVTTESLLKKQHAQQIERDEITYYLLDTAIVFSISDHLRRYTYTYDEEGRQIIKMIKHFVNEEWVNLMFENINYNASGLPEEVVTKNWLGSSWINSKRTTYTYNESNHLITEIEENWSTEAEIWVFTSKINYTRNSSGSEVLVLYETWNGQEWENLSNEIYIRDEFDNILELSTQDWNGEGWTNISKLTNTYNDQNLNDSSLLMSWTTEGWENVYLETKHYNNLQQLSDNQTLNFVDSLWIPWMNYEHSYDDAGLLESSLISAYTDGDWLFDSRKSMLYNEWGSLQSYLMEIWQDEQWNNALLINYNYDSNGNAGLVNLYSWENESWQQTINEPLKLFYNYGSDYHDFFGFRINASYQSILVDVMEFSKTPDQVLIYPNPAHDLIFIRPNAEWSSATAVISLIDYSGRILNSKEIISDNKGVFSYDLGDLPSGLYLVKIERENQVITQKIFINN
jgi:hypothetical protein